MTHPDAGADGGSIAVDNLRGAIYVGLGVLLIAMAVLLLFASQGNEHSAALDSVPFKKFQRNYLLVYCFMVAGDWLQGPYVYHLYDHYGYTMGEIGQLFIAGFGASMVVGTFIGSACDKIGRKVGCVGYAVLYALSCTTKHAGAKAAPSSYYFWILMVGRLLGGIATSLLFSAFDSWMVTEHKSKNFPAASLSQTFSRATIANGLVGVGSGFLGQWASDRAGPVAPFDCAIAFMLIGGAIVLVTWAENYGNQTASGSVIESIKTARQQCRDDPTIVAACMVQSFFEAAMYTFIFMWTPAIEERTSVGKDDIPFGLIFASFMVSMMLGSSLFSYLCVRKWHPESMMMLVLTTGMVVFSIVLLTENVYLCLFCFCVFEGACGVYFPAMGMLKAEYIPDSTRSTIMNLARVPLNFIVCVTLIYVGHMSTSTVFCLVVVWLMLGAATSTRLRKTA
jgi:hypothetical protein